MLPGSVPTLPMPWLRLCRCKNASGGQGDFLKKVPLEPQKLYSNIAWLNGKVSSLLYSYYRKLVGPFPLALPQRGSLARESLPP